MENKPLIVITGPTASGKSACALELAEIINGEIISADSMQVYKYMDIGTAKPSKKELQKVRHYLVDVAEPDFDFSVAKFSHLAKSAVSHIYEKGKIPILAGGTGFYINALIYGNDFEERDNTSNLEYREYFNNIAVEKGNDYLFDMLKKVDSDYCEKTHANNVKRVIRALEYFHQTGEKFSVYNERKMKNRTLKYNIKTFIINRDRWLLYDIINKRVDKMLDAGLVDEVLFLKEKGYTPDFTSMQGLGYKEIYSYLTGKWDLETAVEILKRDTRHFAKRQLTWFKHQIQGEWLDAGNFNTAVDMAKYIYINSREIYCDNQ